MEPEFHAEREREKTERETEITKVTVAINVKMIHCKVPIMSPYLLDHQTLSLSLSLIAKPKCNFFRVSSAM